MQPSRDEARHGDTPQDTAEGRSESPAEDATGPGEHAMGVDRLLTLSDGIFAIAMTLLVLDISVPEGLTHAAFMQALGRTWSRLGAYALSFAVIAGVWREHHRIFRLVQRSDARVTRLTLALLATVALLPYPTSLLAGTAVIALASIAVAFAASATAGLLTWLAAVPAGFAARRLRRHPGGRTLIRWPRPR